MIQKPSIAPKAFDADHIRQALERCPTCKPSREPEVGEYWKECMSCAYYIPLIGAYDRDAGGCTNAASPCDGRITFEHDGCDAYVPSKEWLYYREIHAPRQDPPNS